MQGNGSRSAANTRAVVRLMVAESRETQLALREMQANLDGRLHLAIGLLVDASEEYAHALEVMERAIYAKTLPQARAILRRYYDELGRSERRRRR